MSQRHVPPRYVPCWHAAVWYVTHYSSFVIKAIGERLCCCFTSLKILIMRICRRHHFYDEYSLWAKNTIDTVGGRIPPTSPVATLCTPTTMRLTLLLILGWWDIIEYSHADTRRVCFTWYDDIIELLMPIAAPRWFLIYKILRLLINDYTSLAIRLPRLIFKLEKRPQPIHALWWNIIWRFIYHYYGPFLHTRIYMKDDYTWDDAGSH